MDTREVPREARAVGEWFLENSYLLILLNKARGTIFFYKMSWRFARVLTPEVN